MMKKRYIQVCMAVAIILPCLFLLACSEEAHFDVVGSKENKVFLNTQLWSPLGISNGFLFQLTKTPIGITIQGSDVSIESYLVARCTKPAEKDIMVTFAYDASLVPEGYSTLPEGLSLVMDKQTAIIPAGATHSRDTIWLGLEGDIQLLNPGSYMVPVAISSAGEIEVDEKRSAALIMNVEFNNIDPGVSSLPGTEIDRGGWSATLGGVPADNIFDGNNNTFSTESTLPLVLEVDMQSLQENITGIRIQNQSRNYCMTGANVYIRESESDEYQLQGFVSLPRPSNSSPYAQYIGFIGPVKARYIKLEITSIYRANFPLRLSEFIPYQE